MKRLLLSLTAGALLASTIPAGAQDKLRLNLQNAFLTANPPSAPRRATSWSACAVFQMGPSIFACTIPAPSSRPWKRSMRCRLARLTWDGQWPRTSQAVIRHSISSARSRSAQALASTWPGWKKAVARSCADELYHKYNVQAFTCGIARRRRGLVQARDQFAGRSQWSENSLCGPWRCHSCKIRRRNAANSSWRNLSGATAWHDRRQRVLDSHPGPRPGLLPGGAVLLHARLASAVDRNRAAHQ